MKKIRMAAALLGLSVFAHAAVSAQTENCESGSSSDCLSKEVRETSSVSIFAPQDAAEHLVMGNPSGAMTDVNFPLNYLLSKPQYVMSYNRDRGTANWVVWHLDSTWIGSTPRQDDYRPDPALPAGWYQVQATDYSGSGFDRGHHCPSGDRTNTVADNSATFFMTNMMPQAPDNNQGPWEALESYCRTVVGQGNELYIYMGGVGTGGTGSNGGVTNTVANGHVVVPGYTWKVVMVLPNGTNDVTRVDNNTRVFAVIMPNMQGIGTDAWQKYLATVDQVEAMTGYDFFSSVPTNIQTVIEARLDPTSNTAPQSLAGGTFTNLNITAPNTTLTGNVTVNGNLTLGGSTLFTGTNKIVFGPTATVTRISGFVNGNAERQYNASPATFVYPVGTTNGYSPVTANVTALAQSPSSLMVKAVQGVHPNATNPSSALKRYWTLTETGDLMTTLTFKYIDADIPIGTVESDFRLNRYEGFWSQISATFDSTANTATAAGISQFSDWTLIPILQPTGAPVSLSGRVLTPDGVGLRNARVVYTDPEGNIHSAVTSSFGYYSFEGIGAGQTIILDVVSKRYQFSTQVLTLMQDTTDVNFVAISQQ